MAERQEQQEWAKDFEMSQQRLSKVPAHLLHAGPTIEVATSSGEKLRCESKFF